MARAPALTLRHIDARRDVRPASIMHCIRAIALWSLSWTGCGDDPGGTAGATQVEMQVKTDSQDPSNTGTYYDCSLILNPLE